MFDAVHLRFTLDTSKQYKDTSFLPIEQTEEIKALTLASVVQFRHIIAGTAARTMAQAFIHPIDTVKTRLQVTNHSGFGETHHAVSPDSTAVISSLWFSTITEMCLKRH